MKNAIFPLLRLGLDNSFTDKENLSDFIMMTETQWEGLGDLARHQGVLGIMLDGVEQLNTERCGATRELKANLKLTWIGEVMLIEQSYHRQKDVMNDLSKKWKDNGCRVMIMKGHANAILYPNPKHRNPGDIDCYLINDDDNHNHNENAYQIGNQVAQEAGAKVDESWYKHSVISYKGETFENHQYFVHTREGKRSKELEKELEKALDVEESKFKQLTAFTVMPPVQWTAMFLTYHACAHFLTEGLRLKQVLDWAMFLKAHQSDVNWEKFYAFCERYHLRLFAETITAICSEYLGVEISNSCIVKDSVYTEKVLNSILYDDDYIYSESEGGWKEKWHIIRNLFHYRWKYEEIYNESVWKQLWYYASGYLFKTEN